MATELQARRRAGTSLAPPQPSCEEMQQQSSAPWLLHRVRCSEVAVLPAYGGGFSRPHCWGCPDVGRQVCLDLNWASLLAGELGCPLLLAIQVSYFVNCLLGVCFTSFSTELSLRFLGVLHTLIVWMTDNFSKRAVYLLLCLWVLSFTVTINHVFYIFWALCKSVFPDSRITKLFQISCPDFQSFTFPHKSCIHQELK